MLSLSFSQTTINIFFLFHSSSQLPTQSHFILTNQIINLFILHCIRKKVPTTTFVTLNLSNFTNKASSMLLKLYYIFVQISNNFSFYSTADLSVDCFSDHSFAAAGPTLWNSLPVHLRQLDLSLGQF